MIGFQNWNCGGNISSDLCSAQRWPRSGERGREAKFDLKPMGLGRWHITADAAEKRLPRSGPFVDNFFFVEREREFYLTPVRPGCGHMAADAAEKRL